MPRKLKHQKKSREETTAEDYFPVDESDLKHTVKKEHKSIDRKSLEKVEILALTEKKKRRKTSAKKRTLVSFKNHPRRVGGRGAGGGTIKKIKEYRPQKISLKKSGYELIITEKPQAAAKIASALGKINKKTNSNVSYYEVERNGEKIIVACAVGHLFTLKQTSNYQVPVFDVKWVPNFIAGKGMDFTKKYYDTISKLAKNASGITIATDYDVEGEVIGMNVMKFICGQNDANRMKFSTLTDKELNQSYEQKSKSINWPNAFAGETRHYLDWFYGINLSRALMNAIKTTGAFRIMSVGRVQGPALNLITKKEKQIQAFKPEKFWQVFIRIKNSHELELKHNKDIFRKQDLKKFENLKGREIDVVTEKKSQSLPPLPPFDLTSLQSEAYKFHGITPARTLQIAQGLYLSGLISYPRTSSQKLPASIAYKEILEKLAKKYKVENLIKRDSPVEGKKSDPAHPSIYPTGNFQILSGEDEKIYNLIAKRFLSLFCEDAIIDNKTIKTEIDKLTFSVRGSSIRKKAWLEIYPMKMVEKEIPDFNGKATITNLKFDEKETQPPKRYSPASIVTELEKRGLGTKATRANIIETLYDRGYIRERSIEATPLGISLIETLEKNSPIIIDEQLTRNFEKEMESIQNSKSGFQEREKKIIDEAKNAITKIINQFEGHEKEIGAELLKANVKLNEERKKENMLNICPICKKGNLAITYSKKTRRYFVACNKYPECKNTYSLPPNGLIKKTEKNCEECGFPFLMRITKGKRPWIFCFNRECKTNKERLEEYRKKQEEKTISSS